MTVGQDQFAVALLDPGQPVPPGLSDPEGRSAGKRFDVYRNNMAVSLTEALETAFPVLRKLLGEENFRKVASVFLRAHPPASPLMMFYGDAMPGFLETFPPVAQWGYLPDVARLELALRHAYHAADSTPIDPTCLQALAPDQMMTARVALSPALRLVRSPWPIHALWRYNMEPGGPKPAPGPQDVLVVRLEFDPDPVLLPPGAAAFIAALSEGAPLGSAFDAALADHPDFDLTTTLGLLLGAGALTGLETTP
ncbi:HvfC/BufC N-terminal domain-containing protein [Ovoidimarina sediminis]|uniref:HvfC/BufC N-terminal domain-containing protein n=1 Tax=Ovoidimarina sediminis TaxID=3079856 RepID=UPI0029110D30|nr:DNA-binding domain-containing protein [Rhodophyticola sp. MJ-SS7]MDU8943414.1 DNA-binding domain-containing protein [Rhodophyticola sp. MJ-SS7]